MDGESINSQSRGTSQQYNQPAGGQPLPTSGTNQPTIEEKAAASTQNANATATVEATLDPTKTDVVEKETPTQSFGNPVIKTVSDDSSHPVLTPSNGNFDDASQGFEKLSDKNQAKVALEASAKATNDMINNLESESANQTPSSNVDLSQFPQITEQAAKLGVTPDQLAASIQKNQNRYFETLIQNLPKEQVSLLQAAYYLPNAVKTPSPEIQSLLTKYTDLAQAHAATTAGVESLQGFPVDSREFEQKLTLAAGQQYDAAFMAYVKSPELQAQLPPLDPNFQPQDPNTGDKVPIHIQQLINRITQLPIVNISQIQAQYNLEETFRPNPDISFYNNVVNGDFAQALTKNIKGYLPPNIANTPMSAIVEKLIANPDDPIINSIPDDQKQQIQDLAKSIGAMRQQMATYSQAYLDNPDDPSIPDDVKANLKQVFSATVSATIEKYGLDKDWSPQITKLSPTEIAGIKIGQNALDTANELLANAQKLVLEKLSGPQQATYLNFLAKIATALNNLQNAIYAMQGATSDSSRKTNALKLQIQLSNLDQQKTAADEVSDKTSKMGSSGGMSDFLKWITNITIIAVSILAAPLFPAGPALAIAYVVETEQKGAGNTFVADMCTAVNSACQDLGKLMGCEEFGTFMGGLINLLLTAIVSMGNPLLFMALFFQESKATENLVAICGGDELAQQITAQVMFMVCQVALMVAMSLATGGAGVGAALANIGQMVAKVTGLAVKTVAKIAQIANWAVSLTLSAMTIATSGIEVNNNVLLAQITMIKGKSESLATELEALVAVLKKLIDKLLASLQGMGDWTTSIGKDVGDLFNKRSSATTDIAFAG